MLQRKKYTNKQYIIDTQSTLNIDNFKHFHEPDAEQDPHSDNTISAIIYCPTEGLAMGRRHNKWRHDESQYCGRNAPMYVKMRSGVMNDDPPNIKSKNGKERLDSCNGRVSSYSKHVGEKDLHVNQCYKRYSIFYGNKTKTSYSLIRFRGGHSSKPNGLYVSS